MNTGTCAAMRSTETAAGRRLTQLAHDHPMQTAALLIAATKALHEPDQGKSVATRTRRGAALRAVAEAVQGNLGQMLAELRAFDPPANERRPQIWVENGPHARPHIGYDPGTRLVWGYGATLAQCQADVGWHLVEAGEKEAMAFVRYVAAHPLMEEALATYGGEVPWRLNQRGEAEPAVGC